MSNVPIQDEFTRLPISRQRKYQLRKAKAGLCMLCRKPAVGGSLCLQHLVKAREHARRRTGARARNNSLSYRLAQTASGSKPPQPAAKSLPLIPVLPPHPTRILDEFAHLPISRQRRYALRKAKQHRCVICGAPAVASNHCARHMIARREHQRKKHGTIKRNGNSHSYRIERSLAKSSSPTMKKPPQHIIKSTPPKT